MLPGVVICTVLGLAGVVWRFIFFSEPTRVAQEQFVLQSLRGHSFDELSVDSKEVVESQGRRFPAHWTVRRCLSPAVGVVIEFDTHPSTFPITFSNSQFIFIRDAQHLSEIKQALNQSNDYGPYFATSEQLESTWRT